MRYEYRWLDGGRYRDAATGIVTEDHCVCSYELTEGDPLSAVARLEGHSDLVRGAELEVRVDTLSELRASADEFLLTDEQRAYDHGELVFETQRRRRIPQRTWWSRREAKRQRKNPAGLDGDGGEHMYFGAHVKASGGVWTAIDHAEELDVPGDPVLRRQPAHLEAAALPRARRHALSRGAAPSRRCASRSSTPST